MRQAIALESSSQTHPRLFAAGNLRASRLSGTAGSVKSTSHPPFRLRGREGDVVRVGHNKDLLRFRYTAGSGIYDENRLRPCRR